MTDEAKNETARVADSIHVAETELKVDLRSPEFIIAIGILVLFGAALFKFQTEQLQTALISALSMAVGFWLGQQRQRKIEQKKIP
jgi:hypothetical protein